MSSAPSGLPWTGEPPAGPSVPRGGSPGRSRRGCLLAKRPGGPWHRSHEGTLLSPVQLVTQPVSNTLLSPSRAGGRDAGRGKPRGVPCPVPAKLLHVPVTASFWAVPKPWYFGRGRVCCVWREGKASSPCARSLSVPISSSPALPGVLRSCWTPAASLARQLKGRFVPTFSK